ncbi:putative mitochondrial alanine aminotransferase (ALAT) [Leptomonas pyrrhocoris]|uniref:Putative mitochondrial alanine aminotransferase (ALAT) n=1 Tax=Leptomonas pyrrhocoris TaxID=157538 RepID=A0A0M9FTG8_LEPPY|nr:putative mitochondrial alanine aminotransferase (ALAT) [Leptomonas pyrrhocoris]XP_015654175.1 putative mitochondrial alanine aminotransferase (ALAT) [Leptomonas pyrrhocoris]KPA75735.1 putative mitochondrial alanine aminotransferase (ALAT) [Leptomonas pyrrhocoris]KPA75736.1 putative mitochondrial alanine aminotransferase (ALAT) [Leptomonas pyrrhocoris]|eukprot:XP_015654174.1 putative mitochondrial alanine aminotransferase (ALAT) [Leptomonas pyrrhocoris]
MSSEKAYVNPHVVRAEYAVRGLIPARADEIKKEIAEGKGAHPFTSLVYCNIGNPQSLDQKPLTFNRQVMALFDAPFLLEDEALVARFPADAVARAKEYVDRVGNVTGAYTDSFGYDFAREAVAACINERDHHVQPEATMEEICMTDGASGGITMAMELVLGGLEDAVMIPIPQYPFYTAQIALLGAKTAPYYLHEADRWAMQADDLAAAYNKCMEEKKATPRLLVCINPGNPTGGVLDRKVMEDVVRFCYDYNVLLLADEVYQENIYAADRKFVSFREVVLSMPAPYSTGTMLVSLHSTSKGMIGECGRRGGFLNYTNLPAFSREMLSKLASLALCANVNGQVMTALMSTPPQKGDASYESYWAEYNGIFSSLKERAALLARELNTIRGMSCQLVDGAMYAFPQITLPARYAEYNEAQNKKEGRKLALDARWSLELLEATGIVVVPGSGFGQEPNTLHFRTTILPPTAQMERMVAAIRDFQEKVYKDYA